MDPRVKVKRITRITRIVESPRKTQTPVMVLEVEEEAVHPLVPEELHLVPEEEDPVRRRRRHRVAPVDSHRPHPELKEPRPPGSEPSSPS